MQSGITLESWQGEKYFVFNVWVFYFDFFIGKKLLSPLCQAMIVVSLPVRLWILSLGIEDENSHPTKNARDSMDSCDWCQRRLLDFSGFIFKLDQTSETTFRYQQSQYADYDASVKKASDQDLWSEALCVKSDTCLINGEMKCQISLWEDACVF